MAKKLIVTARYKTKYQTGYVAKDLILSKLYIIYNHFSHLTISSPIFLSALVQNIYFEILQLT